MDRLYLFVDRISRYAAWCSGGLLLLGAVLITVDVIVRKVLNLPMAGGSVEIAGYILAISTSWALAFSLVQRANVRIDVLYTRLSKSFTAWLDLFGLLMLGGFLAVVTWFVCHVWMNSIELNATSNTPLQTLLAIPQGLWLAGFILFLVVWVVLLMRVIILLTNGDMDAVSRVAGIPTVDEEVRSEVSTGILDKMQRNGDRHVD